MHTIPLRSLDLTKHQFDPLTKNYKCHLYATYTDLFTMMVKKRLF